MFSFFKRKKGNKDRHHEKELRQAAPPVSMDDQIRAEIGNRLMAEKYLKEHNIDVAVFNGVVTLNGTVTSPLLVDLAEEIVTAVTGVSEVHNKIELGIGRAGEDVTQVNIAPDDVALSEASNTGDESLHHPSTTAFTEVRSVTTSDYTGGTDTGHTADEAAQFAIPQTGEGSSVIDAGAVDAIRMSGAVSDDTVLARMLTEGMAVYDREGNKLGAVKEVRSTDFLLDRTLKQDIYVPYYAAKYADRKLSIDVLADEIDDQGWAKPILF